MKIVSATIVLAACIAIALPARAGGISKIIHYYNSFLADALLCSLGDFRNILNFSVFSLPDEISATD